MNVFDLQAKISLDAKDYEKGLGEAKSKFSGFADGLKSAVGKVGDVLAGIGKAAAVGVGAASTALTALTKQSLDAVGSYEQLVGGVDTLFKDASQKVQEYANQAYMTAGLSANEYMETTIQFSASLIQGLKGDTQAAADIANTAITDMADNVNKMGTTMEAVQNAYRGLSRQNFMMLDNLALGYQGTAAEMARLINDSGVMGDAFEATAENVKEISFDKYIEAIHVIQKEMGITGTTSKEAAGTITGSVASMKAAFQNFLTGTGSAKQFTDVLSTAFGNVKNNLKDIIPRLTEGLTELVDLLAPEIPAVVEDLLPPIIQGSSTLLTGLAKRLPQLLTAILPSLAEGIVDVTTALVGVLPDLISSLKESIPIVLRTIWSKKDELAKAGEELIDTLIPSEPKDLINKAFDVLDSFLNAITSKQALDIFFDEENGAIKIIGALGEALVEFSINLLESATTIIKNLGDYLNDEENRKQIFESAKEVVIKIGKGLTSPEARDALGGFVVECAKFIADTFIGGIDWDASGGEIAKQLINGFYNNLFTTKLGTWLGEHFSDDIDALEQEYLMSDTDKSYTEWRKDRIDAGNREAYNSVIPFDESQLNSAAQSAYWASQHSHGYATGFYATQPTWLNNTLVGENGSEVLLPLDRNTEWMDKLADKLGSRMSGGIYITVNAPTGNADDIVAALDEALRNRQIAQDRSTGGTGWK